jgi:beta-glucosidase-like glycosyl hydrolase
VTTGRVETQRAIRKAVKNGKISEKQIDRSVQRIIEMKIRRGIIK